MARIAFVPPIIRAALATLEAAMPAHVAAFNAEGENEVELAVPVAYVFGAEAAAIAYPFVEVAAIQGRLGPFSLGEAGVGDSDHDLPLSVVVWLQGTTGEVPAIYEQSLGYLRCVVEILAESGAVGPSADVSAEENAIEWEVNVIPADPADVDRELRRWKVAAAAVFQIEALERWQ